MGESAAKGKSGRQEQREARARRAELVARARALIVRDHPAVSGFRVRWKPPMYRPRIARSAYLKKLVRFFDELPREGAAQLAHAARELAQTVKCTEPQSAMWIVSGLEPSARPPVWDYTLSGEIVLKGSPDMAPELAKRTWSIAQKKVRGSTARGASEYGLECLVQGRPRTGKHPRLDRERTKGAIFRPPVDLAFLAEYLSTTVKEVGARVARQVNLALVLGIAPPERKKLEPVAPRGRVGTQARRKIGEPH